MKTIKMGKKGKKGKGIVDRAKDPSHPSQRVKTLCNKSSKKVLAIDPGKAGAFVLFDGKNMISFAMPLKREGKDEFVSFSGVIELLQSLSANADSGDLLHVYLERAISFGMGTKGAFNYGRGFAALEIALDLAKVPVTYVEPGKWTKEMHAGISGDLKPKAKSLIAVKRLFPQLVEDMPRSKKGALLDGPIDALLIAAYGLRQLTGSFTPQVTEQEDLAIAQEQDEREAESADEIEYDFM